MGQFNFHSVEYKHNITFLGMAAKFLEFRGSLWGKMGERQSYFFFRYFSNMTTNVSLYLEFIFY